MGKYRNANLPGLSNLMANGTKRKLISKFIVKDSQGMDIQQSNKRAINEGKIMLECHYFVNKKGIVNEVRPEEYRTDLGIELLDKYSILIEVEGEFTWENMNQGQYNAIMKLIIYLKDKYKTYNMIELLSDFIKVDNPGPAFPLDEINLSIEHEHRYGLGTTDTSVLDMPIKNSLMITIPYTRSKEVLILKHKLIKAGIKKIVLNDIYDEETAKMVNAIKFMNGMSPDYICTPETVKIIDKVIERQQEEVNYVKNPTYKRLLYVRTPNMKGDDVIAIQEKLYGMGLYRDELDGVYDDGLARIIASLQSENGIASTGRVDVPTWNFLFKDDTVDFSRVLYVRDEGQFEGADVIAIQIRLDAMGYEVTLNGIYDVETEAAIKKYQEDNGMDITGIVNKQLYNKIIDE